MSSTRTRSTAGTFGTSGTAGTSGTSGTSGTAGTAPEPIRHGEILLLPCTGPGEPEITGIELTHQPIVGHSETGHHHVLECPSPVEVIRAGGTYVRLTEPAMLVQRKETDRHRDLPVPAGMYAVLAKTEYHPFERRLRAVID